MLSDNIRVSIYASFLFTVLGFIAWISGQPFIFPSLGPSCFVLAFYKNGERTNGSTVIGSHIIGALCGLLSYNLLAKGVVLTGVFPPFSIEGFLLSSSGVLSIGLTSLGMIFFDVKHPPACATTLIVSLGLLYSLSQVSIIIFSIIILVIIHKVYIYIEEIFN